MTLAKPTSPEFSRPVAIDDIATEMVMEIDADADERARLAQRLGIVGIRRLHAHIRLAADGAGRMVRLDGTYVADLTQTCVVTLEDLPRTVSGALARLYDAEAESADPVDEDIEFVAEDPPDPVEDGLIDVGETVAEQLALDIDPFPRKADAVFDADTVVSGPGRGQGQDGDGGGDQKEDAPTGPFAALAQLRDRLK